MTNVMPRLRWPRGLDDVLRRAVADALGVLGGRPGRVWRTAARAPRRGRRGLGSVVVDVRCVVVRLDAVHRRRPPALRATPCCSASSSAWSSASAVGSASRCAHTRSMACSTARGARPRIGAELAARRVEQVGKRRRRSRSSARSSPARTPANSSWSSGADVRVAICNTSRPWRAIVGRAAKHPVRRRARGRRRPSRRAPRVGAAGGTAGHEGPPVRRGRTRASLPPVAAAR
jgi:hypothetical protein